MPLAPYRPTAPGRYRVFWHVLPLVLATLWLTGCGGLPPSTSRTPSTAIQATPQLPLAQWLEAQRTAAPAPGNGAGTAGRSGFQLLETSEAAYRRRLALIDNARQTLDLQYYTIHYDPSTILLLDRLRQAARRGVRVRLLLDDVNAVGETVRASSITSGFLSGLSSARDRSMASWALSIPSITNWRPSGTDLTTGALSTSPSSTIVPPWRS